MEASTNEVGLKPQRVTKEVWAIVEREPLERAIWIKVGVAWENRDGSIKVVLNVVPLQGELLIRDPKPFEPRRGPAAAPL